MISGVPTFTNSINSKIVTQQSETLKISSKSDLPEKGNLNKGMFLTSPVAASFSSESLEALRRNHDN